MASDEGQGASGRWRRASGDFLFRRAVSDRVAQDGHISLDYRHSPLATRHFRLLLVAWILGGLAVPRVLAQTASTGAIVGAVRDQTGAGVPGVAVKITRKDSGAVREVLSNAKGGYVASLLSPGRYSVAARLEGFQTAVIEPVVVRVTVRTTLDLTMLAGGSSDTVLVTAEVPLINTGTATQGEVIEETSIRQLPLPTLNFQQLLALSPGASASLSNTTDLGRGDTFISVNGQRMTSNNMTINGTEVISAGSNSTVNVAVPAPDTLQEFVVQTSLFNAASGRNSGGNVAVLTKSGSNDFHGLLYEFVRNRVLNANDFFLNSRGRDRPILTRNQFGGTLGGPILKDKVNFFVSYQGTRERNGTSLANSLATPNIPAGLTEDRSTAALQKLADAHGTGAMDPVSLRLLQARLPNGQYAIPSAGAAAEDPTTLVPTPLSAISRFNENQSNVNIDLQIGADDRLDLKVFFSRVSQYQALLSFLGANPFQAPGYGGYVDHDNWVVTLSETHVFNPRIVNRALYGFNSSAGKFAPEEPFTNAQFGIANPLANDYPGLSTIGVTGLFTIGSTSLADGNAAGRTHNWSDTLSWSRGRHDMTLGGLVRHTALDLDLDFYSRGSVLFSNFKDFLGGITAVAFLGNGIRDRELRTTDLAWFFQDDIRLTGSFTLNAGVRFEHYGGISENEGRFSAFYPEIFAKNQLPCTPATPCNPPNGIKLLSPGQTLNPGAHHFAPRLGFAWSPFAGVGFVVRGGSGVYFDKLSLNAGVQQVLNYPYGVVGTGLAGPFFSNPFPDLSTTEFPVSPVIPSPVPYYAGGVPSADLRTPINGLFVDPNLRTPYVYVYSLGIQWQPFRHYAVEIDYVGNKGTKLINTRTLNQGVGATAPYTASGFSNNKVLNGLQMVETTGVSHYDSLQASLKRRFDPLDFLVSYTFSKSMDDYSGAPASELNALPGDQQDRRSQRALSNFDRTHRVVANFVWFPKVVHSGGSTIAGRLLNDWQFSGIVTVQSGIPFSVISTSGAAIYNRADLVRPGNGAKDGPVKGRLDAYFDPTAFAVSLATTPPFGSSSRNILRGPGQKSIDFSIGRSFRVISENRLELRAEFFNLFNFVNFSVPNNNMTVPGTVGRITSTSTGPRVIQCALKYNF